MHPVARRHSIRATPALSKAFVEPAHQKKKIVAAELSLQSVSMGGRAGESPVG
jgi:hypothetical protein